MVNGYANPSMASATTPTSSAENSLTSAFGAVSLSNGTVVAPPATTAPLIPSLTTSTTAVAPTTPTTKTTAAG